MACCVCMYRHEHKSETSSWVRKMQNGGPFFCRGVQTKVQAIPFATCITSSPFLAHHRFPFVTGFSTKGHPSGNLAILLIHISYSLQFSSLHHLPRKSWDIYHQLFWSYGFFTIAKILNHLGGPTELPPRSGSLQPSYEAMIRSSFRNKRRIEKITCQWRIAAEENVGI